MAYQLAFAPTVLLTSMYSVGFRGRQLDINILVCARLQHLYGQVHGGVIVFCFGTLASYVVQQLSLTDEEEKIMAFTAKYGDLVLEKTLEEMCRKRSLSRASYTGRPAFLTKLVPSNLDSARQRSVGFTVARSKLTRPASYHAFRPLRLPRALQSGHL